MSAAEADAPTPFLARRRFLQLLTASEQAVAAGAVNRGYRELVRELSDLAIGPLAEELARDPALRQRWDVVFAHSDGDLRRHDAVPLSPSLLTPTQARLRAQALIESAESLLARGQTGQTLAGVVSELQGLSVAFDLPTLYGGHSGWGDRVAVVVFAAKDAR